MQFARRAYRAGDCRGFHFANSIRNAFFFEISSLVTQADSDKKKKKKRRQMNFNLNVEPHKSDGLALCTT